MKRVSNRHHTEAWLTYTCCCLATAVQTTNLGPLFGLDPFLNSFKLLLKLWEEKKVHKENALSKFLLLIFLF